MKRLHRRLFAISALGVAAVLGIVVYERYLPISLIAAPPVTFNDATLARGEYLAKVGNCAGCHSARGGEAFAGGRRIQTPFGSVAASNISPDPTHGIGAWSADDFYRALHDGRGKDGRLLSPAFPYTNTTLVSRSDSDAMYAYFMRRVIPVAKSNEVGSLGFPSNSQVAIALWRTLFFTRAEQTLNAPTEPIARGRYLADGLAHCSACHGARNMLGGPVADRAYAGAMMPLNDWYAPSLQDAREASVAQWSNADVAALLQYGINANASVLGPMADVVFKSTQHLSDADANAMAAYLKSLPQAVTQSASAQTARDAKPLAPQNQPRDDRGAKIYAQHCESCHGANGEGVIGAYPALTGNRAVVMLRHENLIRIVLEGGFAPATRGNPAPYGMTPFYHLLKDDEIAAVLTHIRESWGNDAPPVTRLDMANYRNRLRFVE